MRFTVLPLSLLLAGAALAEGPLSLDDILQPIRDKHKLPGLSVVVVTKRGVEMAGAVGTRRKEGDDKVAADDLWHLGSCTKAMTATLVARLVEKKKLKWDTTLGESFPKLAKTMDEGWKPVTLEQLLTNRGGIPANLDADGLWGNLWNHKGSPASARQLLLEGVTKHPPEYPPGTKFLYSNANFAIAGHVAETEEGVGVEQLMKREVFEPLGITTAGFGAPGKPGKVADQPRGHDGKGHPVEPGPGADNPVAIGPAGIVHMSLADWGKFVMAHAQGERGEDVLDTDGKLFLTAASWKKMHASAGDNYAMGWGTGTRPNWAKGGAAGDTGLILTHNGSNTMWFCVCWLAPERGFAVLAATNVGGDDAGKAADEAVGAAIGAWQKKK